MRIPLFSVVNVALELALPPKDEDSLLLPITTTFNEHLLCAMSFIKLLAGIMSLTHRTTLNCSTTVSLILLMKKLKPRGIKEHPQGL